MEQQPSLWDGEKESEMHTIPFVIDNQCYRMSEVLNTLRTHDKGQSLDIATAYFNHVSCVTDSPTKESSKGTSYQLFSREKEVYHNENIKNLRWFNTPMHYSPNQGNYTDQY
ncbi:hypothetical protein ccbrp13_21130 [Ktedonobacteria bacterium brp13]|nr:hypothetical protein ccbrp13_21130 [Ktedonobacteria bacterium brp13]